MGGWHAPFIALGTKLRAAGCDSPAPLLIPARFVSYDDLVELARLCLRQAAATSNPAAAAELRRMASEYEQRAAALDEARAPPDVAAIPEPSSQAQPLQQQQQQPQPAANPVGPHENRPTDSRPERRKP
jgi:hypothetical protein